METITFEPFPKMARLSRNCIITEKLDGTNAQVIITDDGQIGAASRTRLITPGKNTDNAGFASWVEDNKEELLKLGPGRHFGEWYGKGIQRNYDLDHKRFALFNVGRWNKDNIPSCCETVPLIAHGILDNSLIDEAMNILRENGSSAVPGYMSPEGIVIYHTAIGLCFKKTFEHDEAGKEDKSV